MYCSFPYTLLYTCCNPLSFYYLFASLVLKNNIFNKNKMHNNEIYSWNNVNWEFPAQLSEL